MSTQLKPSKPAKVVDLNAQPDLLRIPEISVPDAERALLGGLMLENETVLEIEDIVGPEDFFDPRHRLIFRGIKAVLEKGEGSDNVSVSEYLRNIGELDKAGGAGYIGTLLMATPSAANVTTYARMVRSVALRRALAQTGRAIAQSAISPDGREGEDLLEHAERAIFALGEGIYNDRLDELAIDYDELINYIREREKLLNENPDNLLTGLTTGLTELDRTTSGLQPGDLVVVAAAPSLGKTALALHFAYSNVIHRPDQAVLFFSLEMPKVQLGLRLISALSDVPLANLRLGRVGQYWSKINSGVGLLRSGGEILVDDSQSLTPERICSRARRIAARQRRSGRKLSMIVVDYLQLVEVFQAADRRTMTRAMEIGLVSRSLKSLARELNLPVVALSQLNRSHKNRAGGRLYLSDLRDSGAIEQDADVVCFITPPEGEEPDPRERPPVVERNLYVAKQRQGETSEVPVTFEGAYVRFRDTKQDDRDSFDGSRAYHDVPGETRF